MALYVVYEILSKFGMFNCAYILFSVFHSAFPVNAGRGKISGFLMREHKTGGKFPKVITRYEE